MGADGRGEPALVGRDRELGRTLRAVSDSGARGAILAGVAGVGKSHLLRIAADRLGGQGWTPLHAHGDPNRSTPFGSLGALLPACTDDPERWALDMRRGLDQLVDRVRPGRPLLVADDLHAFDAASATLLQQAIVEGQVRLLGTLQTARPAPDVVTALWKNELVERIEVGPLSRHDADDLVELLLGGEVDAETRSRLWQWSEGNPLLLTELVEATRAQRAWRHSSGLWHLERGSGAEPLRPPTLAAMLADRMAEAPAAVADVVDALALSGHLPVAVLTNLVGHRALAGSERSRLTATHDESDGRVVRLAHPLYGELRRGELDGERIADLRSRLLDVFEGLGQVAAADVPLLAQWYVETGHRGPGTAELLTRAAEQAWLVNDPRAAADLARRARALERDDRTSLLLVNALARLGVTDELDKVADEVTHTALSDEVRASAVLNRALYLFQFANRPDKAEALLTDAAAYLTDGRLREALQRQIASFRLQRGDLQGAQALVAPQLTSANIATVADAAAVMSPVKLMQGQVGEAIALADRGLALTIEMVGNPRYEGETSPLSIGEHLFHQIGAWVEAGRVREAEMAAQGSIAALDDEVDPFARSFVAFEIGRIARLRGRPETAARWFREATAGFECIHRDGFAAWSWAGLASVRAEVGDVAGTQDAADRCREWHDHPIGLAAGEVQRCLVWADVVAGRSDVAADGFEAAAERCLQTGEVLHAAHALHDLVRIDRADRGSAALRELARRSDGQLLQAFAQHAAATVACDAEALRAVATQFESLGYDLHAAEAWSQAADSARQAGETRRAMAAHRRATRCARRCEGARTPLLTSWPDPLDLSRREREIARLTVDGLRRRDIADKLVISARTVDSHLQRIYRKLGVHDREALAHALDEEAAHSSPIVASG